MKTLLKAAAIGATLIAAPLAASAHEWHDHDGWRHRGGVFLSFGAVPAPYYYEPPPVIYAPPPVAYVPPPQFSLGRAVGPGCREYTAPIRVGGRVAESYGTACRQPDGSWRIID
jgi:hypothetical protein